MGFLDSFTATTNSDNRWRIISQEEENIMTIGSSTTHIFSLPFIYSEYVRYCEVIYVQGVRVILTKTDFTVQESNEEGTSMIKVNLSQEDTTKFKANGLTTAVQIKLVNIDGNISYSAPNKLKVVKALDDGRAAKYGYLYKNKINKYFYEVAYEHLNYEYAEAYLKTRYDANATGCTSIRWDGWFARNLDWFYGNSITFLIRTMATDDHYATLGISGSLDQFTTENIDQDTEEYKALPFYINDGINSEGLVMSTNVVPSLGNTATIPTGSKYNEVYSTELVRYCLDHYKSVAELKEDLPKHTSIINMSAIAKLGYESHWLIADDTQTTILEIKNNRINFVDTIATKQAIMANFHLDGVILNTDKTVYTPADVASGNKPSVMNNIELTGEGLERHNYAVQQLSQINGTPTEQNMRSILNGLAYTKSYPSDNQANPFWYSDMVGDGLTIDNKPEDFAAKVEEERSDFLNRVRGDKKTWFTNHASIYDIANKQLYIVVEEDTDKEYKFAL